MSEIVDGLAALSDPQDSAPAQPSETKTETSTAAAAPATTATPSEPGPSTAAAESAPQDNVADYAAYLAAQNQQMQMMMAQMMQNQQQMQMQPQIPAREEPLPDATLETDKYVNAVVEKRMQQFAPMLQQQQIETAKTAAMLAYEQAKTILPPDYQKYEQTVMQLAGQADPRAFANNPNAWKALYATVIGWDQMTPKQQAQAAAAAQTPAAPQGQWPGAKQPPPPVASPGHGQAQTAKPQRDWTPDHLKVAAIVGMSPEELFKEEK